MTEHSGGSPQPEAVLRQAIGDPGSYTPRGDGFAEPLLDWQVRAVLLALLDLPVRVRADIVGLRRWHVPDAMYLELSCDEADAVCDWPDLYAAHG